MYKNIIYFLILTSFVSASNGIASEFSHFAGGLIITGLAGYLIFNYFPKYKIRSILIGFMASMIYVTVDQLIDYIKDGEFLNQLLDFGFHFLGSIIAFLIGSKIIKNR
ncbi:MAG: hypothetical protein IE880_04110 [Epsilonproteobacteria bacterium]|nr:hypothetical protein [Campylobacterota bacterium]